MDIESVCRVIRETVGSSGSDVLAAYVFGSTARGRRRSSSDVDVGVLLAGDPPRTLSGLKLGLEGDLERRLGVPVQVVVLNRAPPDLVHRVLRDGRLAVDRDPGARIRFEVAARREYLDLRPYLDRYRRREAPAP